jgi:hypothetical protein
MVVPGVVYWVWRNTMKENRCPLCNRATLIPTASPIGRAILASPYRLADPAITPQPQDVRLERIEQAIDAIAIEVERVAESQRYAARQLGPSP